MITFEALNALYDYNYWARDRQLEICATLNEEQLLRPMGNSFSSLRDTLAHLLVVEWIWHERFRGRSPRSLPEWFEKLQTVQAIRARWVDVERDVRSFVTTLAPESLGETLSYVNLAGKSWTYPRWRALLHLVNHQTYHRGQVTTLLRQLGTEPPAVDFLEYFDKNK